MKKMMLTLLVFSAFQGWAQTKAERSLNDLVGSWRNSRGAGFDIVDSNTVYIVRGERRKEAAASFSDVRKNPVSFDLTVTDSAKTVTLKGLLLVVNDDTLQWQVFDSETKPVSFGNGRRDMLFLKRINRLVN